MKQAVVAAWLAFLLSPGCNPAGGGGSDQIVPDSVKAGEPAAIVLVLSVWGSGGPIKGRYKDLLMNYRLTGEEHYKSVQPEPAAVPYKEFDKDKFEAYRFTIPAYPAGTKGEIEFNFDVKFDGHKNNIVGVKKIRVE